jgi:hypothetical protein
MFDLVYLQAQWAELSYYFSQGAPSLGLKFALVNVGFALWWVAMRLIKSRPMRKPTIIAAKILLVACNAFVLFEEDFVKLIYPLAWYFI